MRKLPRLTKNSILDKSIWVGVILVILAILGLGISVASISFTIPFVIALVVVFVVNIIYDYVNSTNIYHFQSLIASILVALFAYSIVSYLGTSIVNIVSVLGVIELLIVAIVLEYIGIVIGKELKL